MQLPPARRYIWLGALSYRGPWKNWRKGETEAALTLEPLENFQCAHILQMLSCLCLGTPEESPCPPSQEEEGQNPSNYTLRRWSIVAH